MPAIRFMYMKYIQFVTLLDDRETDVSTFSIHSLEYESNGDCKTFRGVTLDDTHSVFVRIFKARDSGIPFLMRIQGIGLP